MQNGLWQLDSFMKTNCPVIFFQIISVVLKKEKCILKRDLFPGMNAGVVKCDFRYKVVILIRKNLFPGNIFWMSNIPLYRWSQ